MPTEADILSDLIQPEQGNISPVAAREILSLRFRAETASRIRELMVRNNAGTITASERADLDNYLRVGQLIDLLQAKARVSLASAGEQNE